MYLLIRTIISKEEVRKQNNKGQREDGLIAVEKKSSSGSNTPDQKRCEIFRELCRSVEDKKKKINNNNNKKDLGGDNILESAGQSFPENGEERENDARCELVVRLSWCPPARLEDGQYSLL